MGTVAPPFILCPLSESKELVGITSDRLENRVIVTLGKNIAIRYHVLEQKQEASWTCSRHWFTSPVVFCPDFEKYGAVIDHSRVALWDENDAHFANRKKYKFADPIHMLKITTTNSTLIIFKNGTVRFLSDAITDRSTQTSRILDESTEIIDDVVMNEKTNEIILVSRSKPAQKASSTCGVEKAKSLTITTLKTTIAKREANESFGWTEDGSVRVSPVDEEILGGSVVVSGDSNAYVYLCSDGFLYRRSLQSNSGMVGKIQDLDETERKIANLGKCISKSTPAILSSLNASTIVVYGCDSSEDGATVFIYDINYNLMLSKQSLKLFGSPAIMFTVGNNVFVPVGLHILVMGLRLTKSLLSSLVGQHQIKGLDLFENRDPWTTKPWEVDNDSKPNEIKDDEDVALTVQYPGIEDLVNLVKTLESDGQP